MHISKQRNRGLTGAALVGCLILAACGGSDNDQNNTNQNTNQNNNNQTGCPTGTTELMEDVCQLQGEYTTNLTLTPDKSWVLSGGVFIGNDVNETVLTIEAGTQVFGDTSAIAMLVVRRGSRIEANGTAAAPIVFTSAKEPGQRARGDWGGIILNGRAHTNFCAGMGDGCEPEGEGGTGTYGGTDNADSSGTLRYVRIEFAGRLLSPENELNGLALQACGSGTTLEYIQIHMAKDDAIEFYGGTANFKYVLATGTADDNLDWTNGWSGKGQFFVAQQYEDDGDNGIEADNNANENAATPRSHPVVSNVTLIGSPESSSSDVGILLREGTAGNIHNAIVMGWNEVCLQINHMETFNNAWDSGTSDLNGNLTVDNSIMQCATLYKELTDSPFTVEDFFLTLSSGNLAEDPELEDPYNLVAPDFRPKAGSPARTGAVVPNDPFFTQVTFKGGVDPENDWTQGWTTSARN